MLQRTSPARERLAPRRKAACDPSRGAVATHTPLRSRKQVHACTRGGRPRGFCGARGAIHFIFVAMKIKTM